MEVKDEVICIALDDANVHEFDQQEEWSGEEQEQHLVPMCQHQQQNEAMDNMFDELNEHYLEEQALRNNNNEDNNGPEGHSISNWWVFCVSRFVPEKIKTVAIAVGELKLHTLSVESTVEKV